MSGSNSDKKRDSEYQVYLEERKSLIDFKFEETRLFDKAILTLAAGALGLSLTFIKQIAPKPDSWTKPILAASWGSFSLSLLCTLISFITSQYACSKQIEILEKEYLTTRRYLQTGRSAQDVAETMIISVDEVKKCQQSATGEHKGERSPAPTPPASK